MGDTPVIRDSKADILFKGKVTSLLTVAYGGIPHGEQDPQGQGRGTIRIGGNCSSVTGLHPTPAYMT